ncbi:ABC transporter permease subunit [Solirubrobacter sp. CPCC 204708]|uniref:ABC transporter permease subunit n=1 Tax=Solirubrobacter deserti TaxID=2282478 RepID=A0ABT4RDZ4_9ACTN|nr:ABC transporter permease subunit [Solirubrobacter deserti]MBE2315987.1 ABC transporter permease subunit [Solirubrobacter deserti]MDA0136738.1 ABC transporter permease subunit [Solirubrobacter deserti]
MIWLSWRQFRFPASVIVTAAGLLALALLAVGLPDEALNLFEAERTHIQVYTIATLAMLLLPAVIGMFWGAPLVARELEAGTHRLVWNQSVSRSRWLATKLALIGGAAALVAGALGLLLTWWAEAVHAAQVSGQEAQGIAGALRMEPIMFASRGIVPIGYALFAFALGVTAGTLIRRTVPAMAVTAAVFALVQFAVPPFVRAHLGPTTRTVTVTPENLGGFLIAGKGGPVVEMRVRTTEPGAWMIANETVAPPGQAGFPSFLTSCVRPDAKRMKPIADPACFQRLADLGYRQRVVFQPASRYWTLQAIELAGFTALAAGLFGLTAFWVRRRV